MHICAQCVSTHVDTHTHSCVYVHHFYCFLYKLDVLCNLCFSGLTHPVVVVVVVFKKLIYHLRYHPVISPLPPQAVIFRSKPHLSALATFFRSLGAISKNLSRLKILEKIKTELIGSKVQP